MEFHSDGITRGILLLTKSLNSPFFFTYFSTNFLFFQSSVNNLLNVFRSTSLRCFQPSLQFRMCSLDEVGNRRRVLYKRLVS